MNNSITFVNGNTVWITQAEADDISTKLLAGDKFVKLNRLQKTFNTSEIANVGPNAIFFDPLVKDGEFSFSFNGIWAKKDEKEYRWNQGWKLARGEFSLGMPFDDFIATMTI